MVHKHSRRAGRRTGRRTGRCAGRRAGRRTARKQKGGGDAAHGYTGPAGIAAAGVPFESRGASYSQCGDLRGAGPDITSMKTVQFGGRRSRSRSRTQRGGSCGCMAWPPTQGQKGGGGGTGGYGFTLDNSLGKVYADVARAPCPPAPREHQIGGASPSAMSDFGVVSYKSGYGFGPASVMSTNSAHYLGELGYGYDRTVIAGGRRTQRRRSGRKHKKGSRKH